MNSSPTLTLQPQDIPLSPTLKNPDNSQHFKKTWYKKALNQLSHLLRKPPLSPSQTILKPPPNIQNSEKPRMRKCSSLKVATSFTRVCLCAPISTYNGFFQSEAPPRRSYSYPRSKSYGAPERTEKTERFVERNQSLNLNLNQRRVFRGKSLSDDVTMRRFIIEEAMMQQQKRRLNQMEFVRKRNEKRRRKIGPSRLCKMSINEEDDEL